MYACMHVCVRVCVCGEGGRYNFIIMFFEGYVLNLIDSVLCVCVQVRELTVICYCNIIMITS